MKAVVCKLNPLKYVLIRFLSKINPNFASFFSLAKLKDIEKPKLISQDWVLIKSMMSGICGSDIQLLKANESFYLEPYTSKEFVLGHENYGMVEQAGRNAHNLKKGDRVVIQPFLSCASRDIKKCEYCELGEYSLCVNVNEGNLARGLHIGLNKDTSGGWAEYFIAHKDSIFKIPGEISEKEALMVDSFACSLHAVIRNPPNKKDIVIIYGSGTIGLLILASLRALNYNNKIIVVYTREFQKKLAEDIGADYFINPRKEDLFNKISELTKGKIYSNTFGQKAMEDGVNIIYECVGNDKTINNSLKLLSPKGRLVLIATSSNVNIDLAPVWFRELKIIGTNEQSTENINAKQIPTYQLAINLISDKKVSLDRFVTHIYPLEKFKKAIKTAMNKGEYHSLKVALKIG